MPEGAQPRPLASIAEVLLAFAAAHFAFRAMKRFTSIGSWELTHDANLSAAAALGTVGLVAVLLHRPSRLGLSVPNPARESALGLLAFFIALALGAAALALGLERDPSWRDPAFGLAAAALALGASFLIPIAAARSERAIEGLPPWIAPSAAIVLLASPLAIVAACGRPLAPMMASMIGWAWLGPLAEELFFRGYAQGRLNRAFGRPWRFAGTPFGPGLLIAAALFGLIHALNPFDTFSGEGRLAWWWGLSTAASLAYGFLRERTGGILAPFLLHALVNIASRAPGLAAP